MKKLIREESGQSLIMVAIFLIVLVGFAGLAIDGGRLYLAKSQLQKAVDAAALAGGDVIVDGVIASETYNHTDSKLLAEEIAETNYDNGAYVTTFPGEGNVIQVSGEENISLMLMPVLGLNQSKVSAASQVKVGQLNSVGEGVVVPIGIGLNQPLEFGEIWELNDDPGEGEQGWYNFLDFSFIDPEPDNSGNSALGSYIEDGSPAPVYIGQELHVQEGASSKSNNVTSAVEARAGEIIYVPIIEQDPDDPKKVIVQGFAAFELMAGYDGHAIQAKFIQTVTPGEIGDEISEYGTYASKLIL
ncbi:TadE/TadG family type IV pilus assembly protein [Virgibacillus byunsanensis]|uniref:TadE/TadG family type IV pilus assembly protein n=1 Tax=Virgibacillus byunsanensis TaxID=570945 RepID=A0ABW3LLM0_9BACI